MTLWRVKVNIDDGYRFGKGEAIVSSPDKFTEDSIKEVYKTVYDHYKKQYPGNDTTIDIQKLEQIINVGTNVIMTTDELSY